MDGEGNDDDSGAASSGDADSDDPASRGPSRRGVLKGIAGGGALLAAGKSIDNVVLGYGVLVGTNLRDQNLGDLADQGLRPGGGPVPAGEYGVTATPETVRIVDEGDGVAAFDPGETGPEGARAIGAEHGLGDATAELARDIEELSAGAHTFEFCGIEEFFELVRRAEARPYTAGVLRGWHRTANPDRVERFADANPEKPESVVHGLATGFRQHSHYDVARYVAGAAQDNVIMGVADLRAPFREPVGFGALLEEDGGTGMFCYEFTHRSIEAFHAVPAPEQSVPVIGARVIDDRHKHVYTGVASVVRDDGLRVPMTFVDYTHATLYDDFRVRGLLGDGLEGYNDRHRATAIEWRPF